MFVKLNNIPRLEKLTMPVLIDRLVLRKFFAYAIKVCQYLKIPEAEGSSRILAHWACYKVGIVLFWSTYILFVQLFINHSVGSKKLY